MKRSTFLTAVLMIAAVVSARTLTPEEAIERALNEHPARVASMNSRSVVSLVETITTKSGSPAVYLFRDSDREMFLLGADDLTYPLLGYGIYAPDGAEIPPQMRWLLGEYANQLDYVIKHKDSLLSAGYELACQENTLPKNNITEKSEVGPLLTTKWNQGEPYNNMCPMIDGTNCVTGCVATAMAQVMNYHKWPERGTGVGQISFGNKPMSMSFDIEFDWDNMLDVYETSDGKRNYNQKQADAVAELMAACGFSVGINYGVEMSGAPVEGWSLPLTNNFGYSNARLLGNYFFTASEWKDLLKNDLELNGPILFGNTSHAFVCDGYNGELFHFNWGWGGHLDGYFSLEAAGTEYSDGIFRHSALLGLHKPGHGSDDYLPFLTYRASYPKVRIDGKILTLEAAWFMELDYAKLQTGMELISSTGESYFFVSSPTFKEYKRDDCLISVSVYVDKQLPDGVYEITAVERSGVDIDWRRPIFYKLNSSSSAYIQVKDGRIYPGGDGCVIVDSWFNDYIRENSTNSFTLEIANLTDEEQTVEFSKRLYPDFGYIDLGIESFVLPPNSTQEKTFSFDVQTLVSTSATLLLEDVKTRRNLLKRECLVCHDDEYEVPLCPVHEFRVDGDPNKVDANDMNFKAIVSCPSADITQMQFLLDICKLNSQWDLSGRVVRAYSDPIDMKKGESYEISFNNISTEDLEIGDNVRVGINQNGLVTGFLYFLDSITFSIAGDLPSAVTLTEVQLEIPRDIYNLQGILIKRNATDEDIKNLSAGLYIIGGKKFLVR